MSKGASMEARDTVRGLTPLHVAADAGQCDSVAALVNLGAPLEMQSTKGCSPLGSAILKVCCRLTPQAASSQTGLHMPQADLFVWPAALWQALDAVLKRQKRLSRWRIHRLRDGCTAIRPLICTLLVILLLKKGLASDTTCSAKQSRRMLAQKLSIGMADVWTFVK